MEMTETEFTSMLDRARALIDQSHVVLPKESEVKIYHHKGIENFAEVGAIFISVVQHDYCKFIVVMLKGQTYPVHYHRIKDESYFILHGELKVTIEDETTKLSKGELINVPRRFTHSFSTDTGCVFEEVSTAYLNNDSVYEEAEVANVSKDKKVTVLPLTEFMKGMGGTYNGDDGNQRN